MKSTCLLTLCLMAASAFAETVTLNDASINAGETVTLSADNDYVLDGLVFVEEGATLVIEAGVVIRANEVPTNGDNTSALIITRGAQIQANGTAQNPIIMTCEGDDIANPNDFTWQDRGLWGGLIILGRATVNKGEVQIEGIDSTEPRGLFGGNDDTDNSGVLRYVSVRHGGAELAPGDEINGVTFGAVGSGTTVEYVEVFANLDDGFEWFGGTVNTRNLVAAFCADDAFDYDAGWRGHNQFWFGLQGTDLGGRIGEHDGVTEAGAFFSAPTMSNITYIGAGADAFIEGDGSEAIYFRDNTGGKLVNSIVTEYGATNGSAGITVQDKDGDADARERLEAGDLSITNNIWWSFGNGEGIAGVAQDEWLQTYLTNNGNTVESPALVAVDRGQNNLLDPRPAASSPAASGFVAVDGGFVSTVSYRGAFAPGASLWTDGWTALDQESHTATVASELDTDRFINHVTAPGEDFTTTITMINTGAATESVTLQAHAQDGSILDSSVHTVAANGSTSVLSSEAFPGLAVSHIAVGAADSVNVTAGYKVTTTAGATGYVNASSSTGTSFVIVPGESDIVFDGLAVVNHGDAAATVTVEYFAADGSSIDTATVGGGPLAAGAKGTYVMVDKGAASIKVTSTQPVGTVFLRGSQAGATPVYLYQVVPMSGN